MINKIVVLFCICLSLITPSFASDIDQPEEQGFPDLTHSITPDSPQTKSVDSASSTPLSATQFKLDKAPVPEHIHNKGYGVLEGILYPKTQQYTGKLPIPSDQVFDPRTGIFLTQPPIGYVLYRSTADAPYFDRILIDSNLNDTLSDEEPVSISDLSQPTPVKLTFSGRPVVFNLKLTSKGLKLLPRYWREGTINLNGTNYKAAIFKSSYGTDYSHGNVLLIDFNKDGNFTNSEFEILTEAFLLQKIMVLEGRFYTSNISPDGYSLTLARLDTDYGQITFKLPDSANSIADTFKFSFLPQGGSGRDILKIALPELPVTLPTGRYSIIEGLVYNKDFRILLKFACPEFNILKDKRLPLKLDTARMEALARQNDNVLVAAQKTYGPRNIYFNLVGPADPSDPGPELLIYNSNNPSEVFYSDNLEYG